MLLVGGAAKGNYGRSLHSSPVLKLSHAQRKLCPPNTCHTLVRKVAAAFKTTDQKRKDKVRGGSAFADVSPKESTVSLKKASICNLILAMFTCTRTNEPFVQTDDEIQRLTQTRALVSIGVAAFFFQLGGGGTRQQ